MTAQFLFLDESDSTTTGLFALTGILVPIDRYVSVRDAFYNIVNGIVAPDGILEYPSHELHGLELLGWHKTVDDEMRFRVLGQMVDLIRDSGISILRIGYFRDDTTKQFSRHVKNPRFVWSLSWLSMCFALQPILEQDLVIPVMDGLNEEIARMFSEMVRMCEVLRTIGRENGLSINHSQHLGEVLYAKSRYSVFTQMTDLVGYLRSSVDRVVLGQELSPYQTRVSEIGERLAPAILHEERIRMNSG